MKLGFVSTRFAGLDGVTLESAKLAEVARSAGHEVVWFAGELGEAFAPGTLDPDAHFDSDANRDLQAVCFGSEAAPDWVPIELRRRADRLVATLHGFIDAYDVDVLVPQNSSTIPMQLPLGLATAEVIDARRMPAVAHHHDFWWERERFTPTAVPDVLEAAFPPGAPTIRHMVISSIARDEIERRRGIVATVLPNVMDFERPPEPGDGPRFRAAAGIGADEVLLLQPTRIIPRKAIEDTIDLAAALGENTSVVVTHPERDESDAYAGILTRHADDRDVPLVFLAVDEPGGPTLADAYAAADLVSFPSRIEGFGNALLEACYFQKPVLVRRYPVYVSDIAPTGLRAVEIGNALTPDAVRAVDDWLADPQGLQAVVEHNYDVCSRHFSYRVVRDRFLPLLGD